MVRGRKAPAAVAVMPDKPPDNTVEPEEQYRAKVGIMNIVCSVPECGAGLFFTGSFFLSTPVPALAPQEQAKTFSLTFSFLRRYLFDYKVRP